MNMRMTRPSCSLCWKQDCDATSEDVPSRSCRCGQSERRYASSLTVKRRRIPLTAMVFLAATLSSPAAHAFVVPSKNHIATAHSTRRVALILSATPAETSNEKPNAPPDPSHSESSSSSHASSSSESLRNVASQLETPTTNTTTDWTAATSFGSFLLKRQREETEQMRRIGVNETKQLLEQAKAEVKAAWKTKSPLLPPEPEPRYKAMDREAVKELDEAVTSFTGPPESFTKGIKVLPLSSLYSALSSSSSASQSVVEQEPKEFKPVKPSLLQRLGLRKKRIEKEASVEDKLKMPLSMPEHYTDRIGRDMRHLAVSIASNVQAPWQWRLFVEERGGIVPLLRCLQEGAQFCREKDLDFYEESEFLGFVEEYEESLMVACTACRSLRDLCALSPELSSVITDDILRVDAAWSQNKDGSEMQESGLVSDLVTLLRHTTDAERFYRRIYSHRGRMMAKDKARARNVFGLTGRRSRREARRRCQLYVLQLLLAMSVASDEAVKTLRATPGLTEAVLACSSYARKEKTRRWLRYPVEVVKKAFRSGGAAKLEEESEGRRRPFIAAASVGGDLAGMVQGTANQVLAAVGYNQWVPKIPGQKGLRILCLDGGGSRGIAAVTTLVKLVDSMGGVEVCDSFDIIAGTSTGAIIAFLVGLRRESTRKAKERYDELIKRIFVKSALSTPMLLFTTASYDEAHFTRVMKDVLGDVSMLDSRADPAVPLVCAVSSKMSSTPTHVALFRNYNYAEGEFPDTFVIDPEEARSELGLPREKIPNDAGDVSSRARVKRKPSMPGLRTGEGSRHPGSFRVLQRIALRASTAAPTVFKPVSMGGEIYCDGGIVASNPTAVAIHEARTLFPNVPIEMVVSCGTGGFVEEKSNPKFGWDGIIGQIVNSATDGEQIHHILEDVLGQGGTAQLGRSSISKTRYYRLNPVIGSSNAFPIDVTDPKLLEDLTRITELYLEEPEQQRKLQEIGDILEGRRWWKGLLPWQKH